MEGGRHGHAQGTGGTVPVGEIGHKGRGARSQAFGSRLGSHYSEEEQWGTVEGFDKGCGMVFKQCVQ